MLDLTYSRLRVVPHFPAAALGFLALFVVPLVIYWPNLTDFFAIDDFIWLQAASNPDPADFFRRAFSFPDATPLDRVTPYWRPLGDAYFFAGWRVFGMDPLPYHITNVVIHGAIASLITVFAWQLRYSRLTGLLAGLLFVLLPTYSMAVSWISQATELLAVLFYMLTLVLYSAYLRGTGPTRWLYGGALATLLLALLSKESAVTLPVVLAGFVLAIKAPRSAQPAIQRARELAPFVALTLAYFVFLYLEEYSTPARGGSYQFGGHSLPRLWDYLRWMALPLPDHVAPWVGDARPFAAVAFVLLVGLAVALRMRVAGLVFAWMLLALLPYSFFLGAADYRFTYLPSVPFAILVAALLRAGFARMMSGPGAYPAVSLIVLLVFWVGPFLGLQARDQQWWIGVQAELYGRLYHQAPALCGTLPPGSHILLLDSPLVDPYGTSSAMALNLLYDDVYVHRVERSEYPGLSVFVPNKCVLWYRNGRYYDPLATDQTSAPDLRRAHRADRAPLNRIPALVPG